MPQIILLVQVPTLCPQHHHRLLILALTWLMSNFALAQTLSLQVPLIPQDFHQLLLNGLMVTRLKLLLILRRSYLVLGGWRGVCMVYYSSQYVMVNTNGAVCFAAAVSSAT